VRAEMSAEYDMFNASLFCWLPLCYDL